MLKDRGLKNIGAKRACLRQTRNRQAASGQVHKTITKSNNKNMELQTCAEAPFKCNLRML